MSNPDIEIYKLMHRIDRVAERLNPGLVGIAVVLSTRLLVEITVRFPILNEAAFALETSPLSIDPTALVTIDVPPSE